MTFQSVFCRRDELNIINIIDDLPIKAGFLFERCNGFDVIKLHVVKKIVCDAVMTRTACLEMLVNLLPSHGPSVLINRSVAFFVGFFDAFFVAFLFDPPPLKILPTLVERAYQFFAIK